MKTLESKISFCSQCHCQHAASHKLCSGHDQRLPDHLPFKLLFNVQEKSKDWTRLMKMKIYNKIAGEQMDFFKIVYSVKYILIYNI